ncbi:hypothetical protein [Aliikangiella sp. IMCC44359]|uniref:hypothetical protein n=1 Tax=Aliikangiella sp. IMCC44359 TaxID=3459125 RepID=UPI00403A85BC
MKDVDRLVHSRANILFLAAFSFGLWQFCWIGKDILSTTGGTLYLVMGGASAIGGLLWVVSCYFFHRFSKQVKQAKAYGALNDELTQQNRSKAFVFGYFVIFGLTWLLIPATDFWNFEVKFAVRVIATIGIILPFIYFAYLELKNDEGAE